MPVTATGRKYLSDLIKGVDGFADDTAINYNIASATVGGSSTAFAPIGTPLVWVEGNSQFEVYLAQDITAVTGSPLPNGAPVCLSVGESFGLGFNKSDKDLSAGDITATVLHRGPAGVIQEAIEFGAATAPNITEFMVQLEVQGITVVTNADVVSPTYTS